MSAPQPVASALGAAYVRAGSATPIDLWLDGNEGPPLPDTALPSPTPDANPERLRRYPDEQPLRSLLAERFGVERDRVALGAGADELLDRTCRGWLEPGRKLLTPTPCFAMLPRYVRASGAVLDAVPWPSGELPIDDLLRRAATASIVAVTTPNNPTGLVADTDQLLRLGRAAPNVLLLVDLAYVEFDDRDPTAALLELPNALVVRTFSKARGLAGLRVGYALGSAEVIRTLRAIGSPYPVGWPSLRICEHVLTHDDPRPRIATVRRERSALRRQLQAIGFAAEAGRANFVFARAPERSAAIDLASALAAHGIAIRTFDGDDPDCRTAVRITCPGNATAFERLLGALRQEGGR